MPNVMFRDGNSKKSYAHICIYIWIYMYIFLRGLFQNMISVLGIGITYSIFGLVLIAAWKKKILLHLYLYIMAVLYIYICIYIYLPTYNIDLGTIHTY